MKLLISILLAFSAPVAFAAPETKNAFIKEAQEDLQELDKDIEEMKVKVATASETTKAKFNEQLAKMEEKRKEAKSKLEKISSSSGEAWKQLKGGFSSAWGELKTAVKKAKQEFKD